MKRRLIFQLCPDLSITVYSECHHDDGHVSVDYHWCFGRFDEFSLEFCTEKDFLGD